MEGRGGAIHNQRHPAIASNPGKRDALGGVVRHHDGERWETRWTRAATSSPTGMVS